MISKCQAWHFHSLAMRHPVLVSNCCSWVNQHQTILESAEAKSVSLSKPGHYSHWVCHCLSPSQMSPHSDLSWIRSDCLIQPKKSANVSLPLELVIVDVPWSETTNVSQLGYSSCASDLADLPNIPQRCPPPSTLHPVSESVFQSLHP